MLFIALHTSSYYIFCLFFLKLFNCSYSFLFFALCMLISCLSIFGILFSHLFIFNLFHCQIIILINSFFGNFHGPFSSWQIILKGSWSYGNTLCSLNHYVCLISWRTEMLTFRSLCKRVISLVSSMEELSRSQSHCLIIIFFSKSSISRESFTNGSPIVWVKTYFICEKTPCFFPFRWSLDLPNFLFVHLRG